MNNEQAVINKIINSDFPNIRVLGGPGTGKTFQMMRRITRLLKEGVEPKKIFAVTFTRTAASDLIRQLRNLKINGCEKVRASTLHSFCFFILNKQEILNLTERVPRPLLQFEERFLLYDLPNRPEFGGFNKRKERLKAFEAAWARLISEQPGWPKNIVDQNFQNDLLKWVKFHKAMLISELVPITLNYLKNNPECEERHLFEHVLVDEFQDLNSADQHLIELISENANFFAAGDDNQSIYSFRYVHPEDFREIPANTELLTLQECERLPRIVVEIANAFFPDRTLVPLSQNPEGEVYNLQWPSIEEESNGLAKIIDYYTKNKEIEAGQILVLAPNRLVGYTIRDALKNFSIPARSYFQEDALYSNDAQKAWSLLSLLVNPQDRVSLRCWLGFDSQSLRKNNYKEIWSYCDENDLSPWKTLEKLENNKIKISGVKDILNQFQLFKKELENLKDLSFSDLIDMLLPEKNKNLEQLRTLALEISSTVKSIKELKEEMQVRITQPELPTDCDFIRVMSLYKAKGLTADFVVIAGCVDAFIPRISINISADKQKEQFEEQKRLFYVALTRTRNYLFISSFLKFPSGEASKMGAKFRYQNKAIGLTFASRFLQQLGGKVPSAVSGQEFINKLNI